MYVVLEILNFEPVIWKLQRLFLGSTELRLFLGSTELQRTLVWHTNLEKIQGQRAHLLVMWLSSN